MTDSIQTLVQALRAELQEYGELLALLDRQQQLVIDRAAGEIFQSIGLIQTQGLAVRDARKLREECTRTLAESVGEKAEAEFGLLIPLLPAVYRPLVKALVDENNELLVRVQQRARQNHLLLSRSLELMQGLLNSLLPNCETLVYNGQGGMDRHGGAARMLFEAVG